MMHLLSLTAFNLPSKNMLKIVSFLLLLACVSAAHALSAPTISVTAAGDGNVRITLAQVDDAGGYNVYFNGSYHSTHRLEPGSDNFVFAGVPGAYCVSSFASVDGSVQYSPCSASVTLSTTDPAPSMPGNFRATLYSSTVAELFWDASVDDGTVESYELTRDSVVVATVNGRSYFEPALALNSNYDYSIVAIDNENNRSPAATLSLDTGSGANVQQEVDTGDDSSPSVPGNLRGIFYSSTAAEIFWDASFDDNGVAEYEISRDGAVLDSRDGRSYWDAAVDRTQSYLYEVVAIDFNGNRSTAAQLTLGNGQGGGTDTGGEGNDNPEPLQSNQLELQLPANRFVLEEGANAALFVPFSVVRSSGNTRAVNLSLRAEHPSSESEFSYRIEPSNLSQSASGATLEVRLGVGVAPLDFHERRFILSVSDGNSVQEARIIFDVKPIKAPDVYLLAGQSNMEGSSEMFAKNANPGGPDELNTRIRQLNVKSNSTEVFQQEWQFTDEFANTSSPRFIVAEDPLHEPRAPGRFSKEAQFIGMGLSFAKAALPYTSQEIYLVPAAWSATGFCAGPSDGLSWNAEQTPENFLGGTLLADRALTRLNMTLRETGGVFRGILWHQGEADSNNNDCANRYNENLQKLVARFRTEALEDARGSGARHADANIPLVVGSMSKGTDDRASFASFGATKSIVDTVHRNIASNIAHAEFSNNDDLQPPAYPCGSGSCIHFGAAAYRIMGARYHDALRRIIAR